MRRGRFLLESSLATLGRRSSGPSGPSAAPHTLWT